MRKQRQAQDQQSTLRVIGGEWRSRKLSFHAADGLRPTGDRVRETLFNWLAPYIEGATCLDAFAGSGALGIEALSRGAQHCTFVESSNAAAADIKNNLALLKCAQSTVINASALNWLGQCNETFDIIFLDPPFSADLYAPCLELISRNKLLKTDGFLYLEMAKGEDIAVPASLELWRDKKAGQTRFQLWRPV